MTFDPQVPARDKTPYGDFESHPTHLVTGTQRFLEPPSLTPEQEHAAALTVAEHVAKAEVAEVLDMLGLVRP